MRHVVAQSVAVLLFTSITAFMVLAARMQHFDQNKEDFGLFCQNAPVAYFVIRIRK